MSTKTIGSSTSREAPSPGARVAQRRVEARARLLGAASHLFARRGIDAVRLDEIADQADVARGTLYSHFESKDELVKAIVRPVLEHGVESLTRLPAAPARTAVGALLRLYLDLWRLNPDAMRLAYRSQENALSDDLLPLHRAFVGKVLEILSAAAEARLLRLEDPALAAHALARTAVPLLELFEGRKDADRLFVDTMGGLLLRAGCEPAGLS